MSLMTQILYGTGVLAICALIHVGAVTVSLPAFPRLASALGPRGSMVRAGGILCFGVIVIVIAHTIQIWLWAGSFLLVEAFADFPTSFYFSTVTYTTLGYGDLVLQPGERVFATFASITGLLTFGISTAFLISLLSRTLPAFSEEGDRR